MKGGFKLSIKKSVETVGITTRMPVDVVDKLDKICSLTKQKRSEFLIGIINAEYDRINGNPELKSLLSQMSELSEKLKNLNK